MTREEAIKTLKENYCAMCDYGSQDMDSCDISSCDNKDAIKALEQEPKTGMTREEKQKAIDALKISAPIMVMTQEKFNDYIQTLNQVMDWLEQEPKTGHWMKSNIGGAKVCSVCNAHMGLSSFKFCPNCGAKMVEPQECEDNE